MISQKGLATNKIAVLLNINNAKFRQAVHPGDILTLEAHCIHASNKGGKFKVKAFVEDKIAVEAELGFALVNRSQI